MRSYNRFDKMEWLQETCSAEFKTDTLLHELVLWMGENGFERFYDKFCGDYCIKRDPNDPNYDPDVDSLD